MISFILGLIYFLIALSVIVFVHELGHLLTAKKFGVYCHEFSIGMGPKVKHLFTDKSGTEYNLRAIPIGGFVMLAGEEENEEDQNLAPEQLLGNKKPYQKIIILGAGAFMNFVLAFILVFLVFFFNGIDVEANSSQVSVIASGEEVKYPAEKAGLETGDTILAINGEEVSNFTDISNQLSKEEEKYTIEYQDYETADILTTQVQKEELTCNVNGIGISPFYEKDKYEFFASIMQSVKYNYNIVIMSVDSLKLLFTGGASVTDLTGPIGIATGSTHVVQAGFITMILFIAFLSVSIGFINILPFPALDGGRIFIALGELITRRKLPEKIENFINMSGIIFLLGLMLFVTLSDVYRLTYDDDILIEINSENISTCAKPNTEGVYKLSISAQADSNINPDKLYTVKLTANKGEIESVGTQTVNDDKYSFEITGSDILSGAVDEEELVVIASDSDSGLFEVQVDVKNQIGLTRKTASDYKEI